VFSSGTPKSIDGINSKSAWAIAMDTKNTHKNSIENKFKRKADDANIMAPTVLT
jgi:hypothetical protein